MHVLIVETGKHKGKRLKLPDGESIVGRDEAAQIRIASEEVSRTHCKLLSAGNRLTVVDLESRNGTFINGKPIAGESVLVPGDLLVIGPMGFRLPAAETVERESRPSAGRKIAKSENQDLSDDDIQAWLGPGGAEVKSDADTAVIELGETPEAPAQQAIVPQAKRTFRSVAEEAADIIRRHRESLASRK